MDWLFLRPQPGPIGFHSLQCSGIRHVPSSQLSHAWIKLSVFCNKLFLCGVMKICRAMSFTCNNALFKEDSASLMGFKSTRELRKFYRHKVDSKHSRNTLTDGVGAKKMCRRKVSNQSAWKSIGQIRVWTKCFWFLSLGAHWQRRWQVIFAKCDDNPRQFMWRLYRAVSHRHLFVL